MSALTTQSSEKPPNHAAALRLVGNIADTIRGAGQISISDLFAVVSIGHNADFQRVRDVVAYLRAGGYVTLDSDQIVTWTGPQS